MFHFENFAFDFILDRDFISYFCLYAYKYLYIYHIYNNILSRFKYMYNECICMPSFSSFTLLFVFNHLLNHTL